MDTENITILSDDLELAKTLCGSISDSEFRNRAVASVVAAKAASRFFEERYQADSESGLHNIPNVTEKFDISDIYVNNAYIDVRVYFTKDELSIPKSHYDLGIQPVVYMFVKINPDLSGGVVSGFIKPENINKEHLIQDYYYISEDSLESFYDIESSLTTVLDTFEIPNELIYRYIEGSLDSETQADVLRELVKSKSSRIKFAKIVKAQSVFHSVLISETNENSIETADDTPLEEELNNMFVPQEEPKSEEEELLEALDYTTEITPSNAELLDEASDDNYSEQPLEQETSNSEEEIGTLFTGEQEGVPVGKKKKSSSSLVLLLLILIIAGGYFAYKNFSTPTDSFSQNTLPEVSDELQTNNIQEQPVQDAMPVETVEAVPAETAKQEEAASVAIPAIEKHLDASVLVSNLRVEWEIPAAYMNNASAKRYLFRLGKIIQLNLRSDLLLLSKPPLSNKITVELKFNPNISKFEYVGIKDSSGEKTVDNAIEETVKNTLDMNNNTNPEAFEKLQGNPVLIIRL